MNPISFIMLLAIMLAISCRQKTEIVLEKGVSKALADFRNQQISDVNYKLSFDIPAEKNQAIPAKLILSLNIKTLDQPLFLDFSDTSGNLLNLNVNSKSRPILHELEHLKILREDLALGENVIEINFLAGVTSLNRNDDYLYTLLVPDRARSLFPCFDQPDIKARFELSITAPKDWKVMCGAPEVSLVTTGDRVTHEFGISDEMSTYLFSFVAGKFESVTRRPGKLDMKLFYRETSPEKLRKSIPVIFSLHQLSTDFLEQYTAFDFPFQKLDYAAIPTFQYGGMEHVGAIQYKESALFLDSTATNSEQLGRAKLIAHETAHMWFGDLVTMKWFDDVWLKEVFANFMADKIVNPSFPEINHDLLFLTGHYPAAYAEDRTKGTNPIKQPLENLKYSGTLYGNIIYHKAPIMMRQLELAMGAEAFRNGLQEYIKTYQYGNASWEDLIKILQKRTNIDLDKWSDVWVNQSGRPILSDSITYDQNSNIVSFRITQNAEDGSNNTWPQVFNLALIYKNNIRLIPVNMNAREVTLETAKGLPKPESVMYSYNGLGYGVFPAQTRDLAIIPELKNAVGRAQGYINVYENTLAGHLSPVLVIEMNRKGLLTEKEELVTKILTSQTSKLFWHYLTDDQRETIRPQFQNDLYTRLQSELPANIKKTLFGLFSSLARSEVDKRRLYKIWNRDTVIPDLKLNEDDFTQMALKLLLLGHSDPEQIITKTRSSITNPDKRKRFEYLLPSVSADELIRNKFTVSLRLEENRRQEDWVLSALSNIHHPVHQESAIKHLDMSLELLDEIQRTGDIFFPKAWLDATIGQYVSEDAYRILKAFLSDHPNLNPVLLKKLLQSSDDLLRVHAKNR